MGSLVMGQMLSLLLGFILPLILVRLLSKNDYGLYAQFNVILSFCTIFFNFGFSSELYYSYPTAKKNEKIILVFQSFLMLLFAAVLACIILCFPFIKTFLQLDLSNNNLYYYLLVCVFLSVPEVLITSLYVLNHDNRTSILFLPLTTILRVLLILIFYYIDSSIDSVFFAILLSCIIKFLFVAFYTIKLVLSYETGKLIDRKLLLSQIRYALPLGIANSTRILVQQLDKLIVLSFVSPAVYAVYSIAFYGVPGLSQVYLSISQVYIPRMSASYKCLDVRKLIYLYHSMVLKTLSYTVPIIFIVMLFAGVIIPFVFSEKYVESTPYFQIYLSTFIIQSIGAGNILRATGETKYSLKAYIYTAIFILPLTYFLIKYFYLSGAIVSATIAAILPKVLLSFYDAKVLNISVFMLYPWRDICKILIISFVCLLPFVYISFLDLKIGFGILILFISVYLVITFLIQMYYKVFVITYDDLTSYFSKYILRR